jgi:hypothetical protein
MVSAPGPEAGGIFTLNLMPELWKLKLFMEGIRNGYWKRQFVLSIQHSAQTENFSVVPKRPSARCQVPMAALPERKTHFAFVTTLKVLFWAEG